MKLKIDENLPEEAADLLRTAGHDAQSVHQEGIAGASDERIVDVLRSEHRAFITLDLDFADIRAYPPSEFCGLIVLRPRSQSSASVVAMLKRILPVFNAEVLDGKLWVVDEHTVRIRGE
jgi:predicted nuclease of predicted toxin-antitoxin system